MTKFQEHPVLQTPPPTHSPDREAQRRYSDSIRSFTESMWQNERKEMESRARGGEGINRRSSIKRYNYSNT